jgi:hypothetical protein
MIKVVCVEEEIIETKATTPKTVLVSCPGDKISVAWKLSTTIEEWRLDRNICFCEKVTGTNVKNPKSALVSCPGENVLLGTFFL